MGVWVTNQGRVALLVSLALLCATLHFAVVPAIILLILHHLRYMPVLVPLTLPISPGNFGLFAKEKVISGQVV